MTDELTPEEREALQNLPRERMPSAGLEDRVVGAMRERGFLAAKRPGRVVRITTSRVAGLMAACVVLVIGAYSVGLHRGGDNEVLRSVQPAAKDEGIATEIKPSPPQSAAPVKNETREAPAARSQPEELAKSSDAVEEDLRLEWKLKDADERTDAPVVVPASPMVAEDRVATGQQPTEEAEKSLATPNVAKKSGRSADLSPAPLNARKLSAEAPRESVAGPAPRQRSFTLGGSALIVEAPDSVRIIQDGQGRMLLIYTSDGLIRIRLAD
jgi:hypothetical protein